MTNGEYAPYLRTFIAAIVITVVMTAIVLLHWRQISGRTGTIIIPAGNTYLGPTVRTVKGNIYPYAFSAPGTLTLVTFPNDPYDMYAVAGRDPASNVLIGVDAKADPQQTKLAYVQNWWKQFSSLTGVKSVDPFTNNNGLEGYRVKYLMANGESPSLDVFFEVQDKPQYVIHLANGTLDPDVFAKIVDSVAWEEK
jgi:hypothetical protein